MAIESSVVGLWAAPSWFMTGGPSLDSLGLGVRAAVAQWEVVWEKTAKKVLMNDRKASFSIKAITGIDCFHVSLVTVQLACFTGIKTGERWMHTDVWCQENYQWHIEGLCFLAQMPLGESQWSWKGIMATVGWPSGARVCMVDHGILDNASPLFPSHTWYSGVVFQLTPALACWKAWQTKMLEPQCPEVLIQWVWHWPHEFAFLKSSRVLLLQVLLKTSGVVIKGMDTHQATRLSITTLLFTSCVIMGHVLNQQPGCEAA